ncbi:MAG: hypothetical protein GF334_00890 [Candidatus Altiarchaeales archaeon]|nr:hypothetical protein [Candidatus Altiarchaeales archaeon]
MNTLQSKLESILKRLDYRKETEFSGIKFEMSLLNISDEQKMNAIDFGGEEDDGLLYFNEMRKSILSHAIRKIDGEEIPDVVSIPSDEDGKEGVTKERAIYLREFLDKLPTAVTEHLFEVYVDLKEEAEDKFGDNVKYEWFKTPEVREKENEERIRKMRDQAPKKDSEESEESEESEKSEELLEGEEEITLRHVKDDEVEEKKA